MRTYLILFISLITQTHTLSQPISGYVKNSAQQGLEDKLVEVYMTINGSFVIGSDLTSSSGYFITGSYTDIEDEQNQIEGIIYTAGSNSANIEINTTTSRNVSIKLFDITGQEVYKFQGENTGKKVYSLPIEQFANTLYISEVIVNGKIDVNKILNIDSRLYFGKTSSSIKKNTLNKNSLASTLDSIIVSGDAIQTTTFNFGIPLSGNYNVGDLLVDSAFVNVNGRIYKLMEWQQPNNGIENAIIQAGTRTATSGIDGNYNLQIPKGTITDISITHPDIWTRETKIQTEQDTTIDFDVLDTTNWFDTLMIFYDDVYGRARFPPADISRRWNNLIENPITFFIVADTNNAFEKTFYNIVKAKIDTTLKPLFITPKYPEGMLKNSITTVGTNPPPWGTPRYYIIERGETPGTTKAVTATWTNYFDPNSPYKIGEIYSARTIYSESLDAYWINRVSLHELLTGIVDATRSNLLPSVLNIFPDETEFDGTEVDRKCVLYHTQRPGASKTPDKDDGWDGWK